MWDAILFLIFCCGRRRERRHAEPNERTHLLIQPSDDILPTTNPVVDHQKLRDRLGTIVRSKEGKMVNVNNPLPFNLHNKSLHGQLDASSSRSGRSLSRQRSPSRMTADVPSNGDISDYDSPIGDQDDAPSLQTSRSTTSLHPGDASYLPPDADPENGVRRPILNARIVRGVPGFTVGGGRVGRSTTRGRTGRFGDDRIQPLTSSQDIGNCNGAAATEPRLDAGTSILSGPKSGDEEAAPGSDLATPIAPLSRFANAAKISRSFGD